MKFKAALITVLVVLALFQVSYIAAKKESSCASCHTSESILKALCKPPPLAGGEGEG